MLAKFLMFENQYIEDNRMLHKLFHWLNPLLLLGLRIWIFNVFFFSGWLKMTSWDTTIMLFEYEYSVPLISPVLAAYFATVAEILLPSLLLLGVFPRLSSLGLFVLNFVAVISYTDISAAGNQQHILWGVILLFLVVKGAGKGCVGELLKLVNRKNTSI